MWKRNRYKSKHARLERLTWTLQFSPPKGLEQHLRDTARDMAVDRLGRATSSCCPPQRAHFSFGAVQADDPAQVVRQHMQAHFRLHPWLGFREEVCGAHPELQRSEHMHYQDADDFLKTLMFVDEALNNKS